jgi:putative copper resistance protein D
MSDLASQLTALGALTNLLFALVVGTLVCFGWLGNVETVVHTRLNRLQWVSSVLLLLAHGSYLWLQTMVMGDVSFTGAGKMLWPVLTASHYGKTWLLSGAGLAMGITTMCWPLGRLCGVKRLIVALGLALYACGRVGASHAADAGDFSLAEGVHWLHLCSVGIWAGVVLVSAFIVLPHMVRSMPVNVTQDFCARLSRTATPVFVLAMASGIYNIRHIAARSGVSSEIASRGYGHIFGGKALLVLLVLLLAGINREWVLPRILHSSNTAPAIRRFTSILRVEAWLMLLLLIAAAWLAHRSPLG